MEEMPKNYDPSTNEPAILQKWLDGGYYKRREGVGDCTVTIPPPNVTGKLHMGHATDDSIQDAIIRMARMRGKSTRWVLGTDHAGIATQTKVDKKLKSEGISRLEIGRDKFVDACWDWTHEYGGIIVEQIKRMGCSVDFDNERFTMDEDYAQAVRKVFCDWYHDGLIYRGKRIVNWCPNCTTAISDDEAEYKDEKGHLWHLRYPLTEPVNGQDYIVVATTRPETMLGDTGVAVSPKDPEKAASSAAPSLSFSATAMAMPPLAVPSSFVMIIPSRPNASLNSSAWFRPFWPVAASITRTTETGMGPAAILAARLRVTLTTLASSRMSSGLVCRRPAVSISTRSLPRLSASSSTS